MNRLLKLHTVLWRDTRSWSRSESASSSVARIEKRMGKRGMFNYSESWRRRWGMGSMVVSLSFSGWVESSKGHWDWS